MAREMFETEEHLEKERQVIAVVESKWKCEAVKLPISYALDYALMRDWQDKEPVAYIDMGEFTEL